MVTFEQFFHAIAEQESGGDYSAVNARTGASGKYQIMPANIGPWSQQYLGHRVSVDQFRNSPGIQDRLARAVLHDYYNQWGARGAASAWYSGSPSNKNNYTVFRTGEPSIGDYVDSVLERAGTAPGGALDPQPPARPRGDDRPQTLDELLGSPDDKRSSVSIDGADGQANIESAGLGINRADGSGAAGMSMTDPEKQAGMEAAPNMREPGSDIGVAMTETPEKQAKHTGEISAGLGLNIGMGLSGGGIRQQIVDMARRQVGTPYVWGGTAPGGFDCSGLVQWAYAQMGLSLPRISYQQANAGKRIDLSELKPGDLVAWDYSGRNAGADHIAIYAGNGKIVEAPEPGEQVRVRDLYNYGSTWGVSMDSYFN